jgi:copper chaperone CopZ
MIPRLVRPRLHHGVLGAIALLLVPLAVAQPEEEVPAPSAEPTRATLMVVGRLPPGWAARLRDGLGAEATVQAAEVVASRSRAELTLRAGADLQAVVAAVRQRSGLDVRPLRQVTFSVKGKLTPNCPVLVRKALERLDGIIEVRSSLDEAKAWVDYVDGATPEQMVARVKDRAGLQMVAVGTP